MSSELVEQPVVAMPRARRFQPHTTRAAACSCSASLIWLACTVEVPPLGLRAEALTPAERANVTVAQRVLQEGLIRGDTAVINQLVREDYIQHNTMAQDGRAGLLAFVEVLQTQPGRALQTHRALANGDLVALHSTYGTGAGRQVGFDVFRLENGQLAEHWDALQPWVEASATPSGHTLVDGEVLVEERAQTAANRRLVLEFFDVILEQGELERLPEFIGDSYVQHNPRAADGLAGLRAFFAGAQAQGLSVGVTDTPLVVADGNFVLVGSEGFYGPAATKPYAVFYDLFRVDGGKLVEHWDVVPTLPTNLDDIPHGNGLF